LLIEHSTKGEFMRVLVLALCAALAAPTAQAEVVSATPSRFEVRASAEIVAPPDKVWRATSQIGRWWNSQHTYSGDARRMRVDARAGGCFCETWGNGQSVQHGEVALVMEHEGVRTLRILGALGPLQEMGTVGVWTITIAPHPSGATMTWTYRVSGDPSLNLNTLAPLVDGVLNEQFQRLARYAAGDPAG
jgi:uncharacterized protein YndB with AHSA1/START domain